MLISFNFLVIFETLTAEIYPRSRKHGKYINKIRLDRLVGALDLYSVDHSFEPWLVYLFP